MPPNQRHASYCRRCLQIKGMRPIAEDASKSKACVLLQKMPPNQRYASYCRRCLQIRGMPPVAMPTLHNMTPIMLQYASYCKVPPQFKSGVFLTMITPHNFQLYTEPLFPEFLFKGVKLPVTLSKCSLYAQD